MAATLSVASLIVERGLMLGQVVPPVVNEQIGVEAESVDEYTHKKRKVTQVVAVARHRELATRQTEPRSRTTEWNFGEETELRRRD